MNDGRVYDQVLVTETRVAQAVPEAEQRLLGEIGVAVTVLAAHLAVKDRLLANVTRVRNRQLAAGGDVAEQNFCERATPLHTGVEALENGARATRTFGQHERLTADEHEHERLAGGGNGVDQPVLVAQQLEGGG